MGSVKIVVCVKHVPDPQGEPRIEAGRIVRGEDDILNDLDEYAVEEAVQLIENASGTADAGDVAGADGDNPDGEVIALTIGSEDSEEAVLRALQMGATRGVHVCDDALAGLDVVGTAKVLAAAIAQIRSESGAVDLVFTGLASADGMTSLLPAALAAELGFPLLGNANELTLEAGGAVDHGGTAGRVHVKRTVDGFAEEISASLPAVVSVTDQINEPRYPSFKTMRAAREKPLDTLTLGDLADFVEESALQSSLEVVEASERTRAKDSQIVQDTGNGGELLAEYLFANRN